MLPLGKIGIRAERGDPRMSRLTRDEQVTLMTAWSIARSPLMFGGNLPDNDDFTLSIITNDDVLAVNQRSTGGRQLFAKREPDRLGGRRARFDARSTSPCSTSATRSTSRSASTGRTWASAGPASSATSGPGRTSAASPAARYCHVKPHASALYRLTPVN